MSKAILVIDKPNSCIECPCSNFDKQNVCEILVRPIDDKTQGLDGKPNWCPLREVPEKYDITFENVDRDYDGEYEYGWNACLDEILGE